MIAVGLVCWATGEILVQIIESLFKSTSIYTMKVKHESETLCLILCNSDLKQQSLTALIPAQTTKLGYI